MDISYLLELNKKKLFSKLDKIKRYDGLIVCNDLIDALSKSPVRDKRLISGWDEIELKTIKKDRNRKYRMFNHEGIVKYLERGLLHDPKNACLYFDVDYVNKNEHKLQSMMKDGKFITSKILRWLFDKKKQDKTLGELVNIEDLLEWCEDKNVAAEKIELLKDIC